MQHVRTKPTIRSRAIPTEAALYAVYSLTNEGRFEFSRYVLPREARSARLLTGVQLVPCQPDQLVLL